MTWFQTAQAQRGKKGERNRRRRAASEFPRPGHHSLARLRVPIHPSPLSPPSNAAGEAARVRPPAVLDPLPTTAALAAEKKEGARHCRRDRLGAANARAKSRQGVGGDGAQGAAARGQAPGLSDVVGARRPRDGVLLVVGRR
jgi:hypothetical protein